MARSPAFAELRRLVRRARAARPERHPAGLPRRDMLLAGTAAMFAAPSVARAAEPPRVAIVGAGIAGLTAARTLIGAGYRPWVYEASGRVGGRMHSDNDTWMNQQVSERCGELIDSGHTTIRQLARHYGIDLVDVLAAQPKGSTPTYYFSGQYYSQAQADLDFQPVFEALTRDADAAGYPTTFDSHNAAGTALDQTAAHAWIEANVPGGHRSPMGKLIDVAYDIEFGAPTRHQSALNIIYLMAYQDDAQHFDVFGQSDEHYKMAGGNERLPRAIAADIEARVPGTIRLGHEMTSITRRHDGSYVLGVRSGSRTEMVAVDRVILALPFSVLRRLDIDDAGFDSRKRLAIDQLGYGSNVKLQLQFDKRLWEQRGAWGKGTGESYTDMDYQNSWEVTRGQGGQTGILVNYLGSQGKDLPGDPRDPRVVRYYAQRFLGELETVFPGITPLWNGLATLDVPGRSPLLRGSYSFWRVGQYTQIAGVERLRSGHCHFAGEHCSIDFQGYMEGGAREGIRAAHELLKAEAAA